MPDTDTTTFILIAVILAALGIATLVAFLLGRNDSIAVDAAVVKRFRAKLRVWWTMVAIFVIGSLIHWIGLVVLFSMVSFWALREFISMTPTRRGDHRTLFWIFFIFTPLQYILIGLGDEYYPFYSIMIPVYASLFIPARAAIAGDAKRFLERCAKIQAGLLVCVYSLSHAPALLDLQLVRTGGEPWTGSNVNLLMFFVLIAQLSLTLERVWSKLAGRHVIAPDINASRTWEGVLGAMMSTGVIAALLRWATPFFWWEALLMGVVVTAMASMGTLTMSAIKRDRGVTDTGTLVQGHAGILDQIDNICFAAPIFYHVTRFFFT
ncbi:MULTISPECIES: phosphatidate cytidylyltransferase [Rhodopirellula]|uniref:Phosphatidate cytidylyltransferase n=3 Tax=Rhodopirellula TaxID=265488 RepID=Q7UIE0_RHOBA|nr:MULTISPECIES: phosphatidate cytidylyltransferase [Rhodopirellula]EGF25598.1 phosphatidate cytidylyltransferase [Rhodopirellula baltica WH47]EMB14870.1 phosphatidate cytidylyltransferase [Rhodopirellula europaea 6C]CAD77674.1 phosphatidate cytidylyltransferase [Rhodopirellula baltica SH 1]HBE62333.1 phosphatidate cytidylyltransferase [Rhodopirellula baltica]